MRITVRITDVRGQLVRQFTTNSERFAREETARWQARMGRTEPESCPLSVERSESK